MWFRISIILIATMLVGACANKFKTDHFTGPSTPISSASGALIMIPEDGQYDGRPYQGSGRMLSNQIEVALSPRVMRVGTTTQKDLPAALAQARSEGFDYVIEPKILHWEDRATEWSGRPDRITIKIVVWETATGRSVSTSQERASSRWATLGGDHPQDLLPKLLESWSSRVF